MSNELVSAILDGDCSACELDAFLAETSNSPALMRQFSRMTAVRDALAGLPVQRNAHLEAGDFCTGVMSRLGEMDPADRAPLATVVPNLPNVVKLPVRAQATASTRRRRFRPMAGWAAAASVSLVAMVGGRALVGNEAIVNAENPQVAVKNAPDRERSAFNSGGAEFGLMPVSSRGDASSLGRTREIHWTHLDPEAAQELADSMSGSNHLQIGRTYAQFAAVSANYLNVNEPR